MSDSSSSSSSSGSSSSSSSGGPPKSKFEFKSDSDSETPPVSEFKADEPTGAPIEVSPAKKLLAKRLNRTATPPAAIAAAETEPAADETLRGPITNLEITKWSFFNFVVASVIALVSMYSAWRLPAPGLRPALHDEPLQTQLASDAAAPFKETMHGHVYTVTPRFTYHLTGMVVAITDAMGWQDITHKSAGDFLNTNDICVIWGANAETLDLSKFAFTHGDWTCYVETKDTEAWKSFKMDGLSNNHVLPATPEIAAQFRNIRIGDQIAIDGRLVDYSIDDRPPRTTSTVRTDTGNGACEIIYVTGFNFIARHHTWPYNIGRVATLAAVVSFLALLVSIFVLPFVRKEDPMVGP